MQYMLLQFTFHYGVKPFVFFCGLVAIYGYFTGHPIEPMIGSTVNIGIGVANKAYSVSSELIGGIQTTLASVYMDVE